MISITWKEFFSIAGEFWAIAWAACALILTLWKWFPSAEQQYRSDVHKAVYSLDVPRLLRAFEIEDLSQSLARNHTFLKDMGFCEHCGTSGFCVVCGSNHGEVK